MSPCIRRVKGYVYRYVPHYLYAVFVGILLQLLPLQRELILYEFIHLYGFGIFPRCLLQRTLFPEAQGLLPLLPALPFVGILQSHKERIVRKPVCICLHVASESLVGSYIRSFVCLFQQSEPGAVYLFIIHSRRIAPPVIAVAFLLREPFLLYEGFRIHIVRVSRESRE